MVERDVFETGRAQHARRRYGSERSTSDYTTQHVRFHPHFKGKAIRLTVMYKSLGGTFVLASIL